MKFSYPAILEVDKVDPKYVCVTFPDIIGAVTFGEGEEDSLKMAKDLLETMLDFDYVREIKPTSLEKTKQNFPNYKVVMVEIEK